MIQPDTIKLLRECDAGIKMGVDAIHGVIDHVSSPSLKDLLLKGKQDHDSLDSELQQLLDKYQDEGKEPSLIAESMSKLKTAFEMQVSESDKTIADLMTDGCNMGVKSLSKYLNQYAAADEKSKDITKRLIRLEEQMAVDLRDYL